MKRFCLIVICILITATLFACDGKGDNSAESLQSSKIQDASVTVSFVEEDNSLKESSVDINDAQSEDESIIESVTDYSIGEPIVVNKEKYKTNYLMIAIPVTNTGNISIYKKSCKIDIENANGDLVEVYENVDFWPNTILPGETVYCFLQTSYDGFDINNIKIIPNIKLVEAKFEPLRFDVSGFQIKKGKYYGIELLGHIKNTSEDKFSFVYVCVNFFDKSGNFIGQISGLTDSLESGDETSFKISSTYDWFELDEVGETEVVAFPFQYQYD